MFLSFFCLFIYFFILGWQDHFHLITTLFPRHPSFLKNWTNKTEYSLFPFLTIPLISVIIIIFYYMFYTLNMLHPHSYTFMHVGGSRGSSSLLMQGHFNMLQGLEISPPIFQLVDNLPATESKLPKREKIVPWLKRVWICLNSCGFRLTKRSCWPRCNRKKT